MDQDGFQPLFLAADILSTKKYGHVHTKYSKMGFASKVKFKGFKIEGLTNASGGLWFYSIQGVFKAAFEHGDLNVQTVCMKHLQGMWLSCTHLPPLESSIEASLDLSNVEPVEVLVSNIKDATVDRAQGANECAQGNDNPLTPHASLPSPDGDPDKVSPRLSLREKDFVAQLLNDLHRTVQAKINYSDEHARALDCLCGVLKAFKLDYQASCLADGFPYELLKSYAVIIEDRVMADAYHTEGVARSRGVVLCLLGEWLGKAFASLAPSISTKANAFKERHIESVDNLPPAHQLIAELFPLCMRQLLYSWMSPVEEGGPCNTKRQRTEDSTKNVHPYVQLILEFANNTLVTGVAHVLYSSLLHSQ